MRTCAPTTDLAGAQRKRGSLGAGEFGARTNAMTDARHL